MHTTKSSVPNSALRYIRPPCPKQRFNLKSVYEKKAWYLVAYPRQTFTERVSVQVLAEKTASDEGGPNSFSRPDLAR